MSMACKESQCALLCLSDITCLQRSHIKNSSELSVRHFELTNFQSCSLQTSWWHHRRKTKFRIHLPRELFVLGRTSGITSLGWLSVVFWKRPKDQKYKKISCFVLNIITMASYCRRNHWFMIEILTNLFTLMIRLFPWTWTIFSVK